MKHKELTLKTLAREGVEGRVAILWNNEHKKNATIEAVANGRKIVELKNIQCKNDSLPNPPEGGVLVCDVRLTPSIAKKLSQIKLKKGQAIIVAVDYPALKESWPGLRIHGIRAQSDVVFDARVTRVKINAWSEEPIRRWNCVRPDIDRNHPNDGLQ